MADIQATMALDYAEFRRGLKDAQREAHQTSGMISKSFDGLSGLFGAKLLKEVAFKGFAFASDSIKAFAKDSVDAQNDLREFGETWESVKAGIGEDLMPAVRPLMGVIETLNSWRKSAVNAAADFWGGGDATAVDAAREEAKEQERTVAALKAHVKYAQEIEALRADNAGNAAAAATARERLRHEEAMAKTGKITDERLRAEAVSAEDQTHALKMQHIEQEAAAMRAKFDIERAAAADAMKVREMTLAHLDKEAKLTQVLNAYQAQIRGVENDGSIPPAEQARRIAALRNEGLRSIQLGRREFDSDESKAHGDFERGRRDVSIDILNVSGHKELAELARIRLDYAEREARVRESTVLSQATKELEINELMSDRDRLLLEHARQADEDLQRQIDSKVNGSSFRGISAGLGGDFAGAVLMGGRSTQEDYELKKLNDRNELFHQREADLLMKIAENTGRAVAIAG